MSSSSTWDGSNSTNGVDPTDPSIAGGDGFNLDDVLLTQARFVRISAASYQESHPHSVTITKEAPNYRTDWE